MPASIVIRTGIPDELGGADIVFANVFERPERPGTLSVLLLHAEERTLVAPGDLFSVGGGRYRLDAIEEDGSGYRAVVIQLDAAGPPSQPRTRESREFEIAPIAAHELAARLRILSPAILGRLGGGGAEIPVVEWRTEARDRMTTEWNGEQTGPITTTQYLARFGASDLGPEATISVEDIRFGPDEVARQEVAAFWRAGGTSAHIFLRVEGTQPATRFLTDPRNAWLAEMISQAVSKGAG